jgi:hypothetical protein
MATARKRAAAPVEPVPTPVEDTKAADQEKGRAAYALATKRLRETYREEFDRYLDEAYAEQGIESPRVKRVARLEEEARVKAERQRIREERARAKVEKLEAELAAAKAAVTVVDDDPMSVFSEE